MKLIMENWKRFLSEARFLPARDKIQLNPNQKRHPGSYLTGMMAGEDHREVSQGWIYFHEVIVNNIVGGKIPPQSLPPLFLKDLKANKSNAKRYVNDKVIITKEYAGDQEINFRLHLWDPGTDKFSESQTLTYKMNPAELQGFYKKRPYAKAIDKHHQQRR